VSSLGGSYTILGATLGPTPWFRHGDWVEVQLLVPASASAAWSPLVYVGGQLALANRRASLLPRRFFVLAAARTSASEPRTALCSHCHRSERHDTARAAEVRVDELLLVCVRA
jgi:hypothetical protein